MSAFHGLDYDEAWDMSPIESERMLAIANAFAIPPDSRVGGVVDAPTDVLDSMYG